MSCGCIIPIDYSRDMALCDKCSAKFSVELQSLCPKCGNEHIKCRCRPRNLSGNVSGCIHVSRYTPWESVTNNLILRAKDNNYKYLYELMANESVKAVKKRVPDYRHAVITYMPREKSKIRKSGVDQSKDVAKLVAKKLSLDFIKAICRVHAKEQKGLSSKERLENAFSAYRLNKKAIPSVAGKTVIVYDDVLTTGATMSAGVDILFRAGAARVFVLAFAMRYNDRMKPTGDVGVDISDYDASDEFE